MKKAVALSVLFVLPWLGHAQTQASSQPTQQALPSTQIMKVEDVRPGMKGVGYTVFQGTKPETMGVEVLGVLRNLNGPKSDVVLVRLQGDDAFGPPDARAARVLERLHELTRLEELLQRVRTAHSCLLKPHSWP